MRKPTADELITDGGIEIAPAAKDHRLDQRGPRSEKPPDPPANRATDTEPPLPLVTR